MDSCRRIDALVTPYVDGELDRAEREVVEAHLQRCPPCRSRVTAEQAVCILVKRQQGALTGACAPAWLRERCARTRLADAPSASRGAWLLARGRVRSSMPAVRWALAATAVLAVSGAILYRVTVGAPHAIAAELVGDHAKCFLLNTVLRTHQSIGEVEAYLRAGFDWSVELPKHAEDADLHLVGSRPCLYEDGKVAHIMYRHRGVAVSVFMLPGVQYAHDTIHALGHDAIVWTGDRRTFVLVAKAPPEQLQQVATFVKASLH